MLYQVVLVALGGAIGSSLRHLANLLALRLFGPAFPWGTLAVNLIGCFVMGIAAEVLARRFGASNELRLFVATGILGGFTTFSAFSLDVALLSGRGAIFPAFAYVAASVVLGIAALFIGMWLAKSLT